MTTDNSKTTDNTKHKNSPKGFGKGISNVTKELRLIENALAPAIVENIQPVFEKFRNKQFQVL